MLRVIDPGCDYQTRPINICHDAPTLTWKLLSDLPGEKQAAFRVEVYRRQPEGGQVLLWDSGPVDSPDQRCVYAGPPLHPDETVLWRVRVRDSRGGLSPWTGSEWTRGMRSEDWQAEWIGFDRGRDAYDPSVPYFCADDFREGINSPFLPKPEMLRKEFFLESAPLSARLYVTALGLARVFLNGREAAPVPLLPGVCDFRKRAYCFAFDVGSLLTAGKNAVSAVLADGWYAGYIGLNPREWWGSRPRLKAEIHLTFRDGTVRRVLTDGSWKAETGPWLYADVLHGCGYDAQLEPDGWKEPGFDDTRWSRVQTGAEKDVPVCGHPGVPIGEGTPLPPVRCSTPNDNEMLVDFGRCFSGVVRLKVQGPAGARIDLYHAEETERDGPGLHLFGNRSAQAHDCYILRGGEEECFQPSFTYHGFRYARLLGLRGVRVLSVLGIPLSSVLEEKTTLTTGSETVNRVLQTILNTAQCNLVDIVTDVCARDERLGWGCEGNLFLHTAFALKDMTRFTRKWLQDAMDGQQENGCFWAIAPSVMMRDIRPFSGDLQSDIALHCAWLLMMHADDRQTVTRVYPALQRHLTCQVRNSDRLLRFATARDWLDLSRNGRSDLDHGYGGCDPTLIGTAWFAMDAAMMAEIAAYLGHEKDAEEYRALYASVREAFRTFFLGRDHLLRGATQGGCLLAAAAGLLAEEDLPAVRDWVQRDMRARGGITWGTATTPVALHGLCKLGLEKEAAAFIRRTAYPSIGYMNGCGATTVWERWDAIMDGRFHPHPMNAFSHVGLATVGEWIVSHLAGVRPGAPGYRQILLEPVLDREIGSVRMELTCPYGPIRVSWQAAEGAFTYEVSLPTGTRGLLTLPCGTDVLRRIRGEETGPAQPLSGGGTRVSLSGGPHAFVIPS